ncbi:hypothetical protein NLU13_9968 [Sarocladium strictum]|uniref:Choline transport protein n=1 Tax=Sarocladium strictum TaxID=5046 RepID=A0AA39GAM8_SARSR|nr:hypothetical protein NLU13_9968 [Sarocladium strictum]
MNSREQKDMPHQSDEEGFQPANSRSGGQPTEQLDVVINASGHVQELDQSFNLLSLAGVGLVVGNVWPAIGGSILVAVYNGGPPGLLYEFITVSVLYWFIAASIAELASAIPSSAGVYHYASVTPGPRWGRPIGFLAGWWNYLAWVLGCASMSSILANTLVQMYAQKHGDFIAQPWHVFVTYVLTTWLSCLAVCFGHSAMPILNKCGAFFILAGFIITVIVILVMPEEHASSAFVWTDWHADIGYPDGLVFAIGMLNGAYSVGSVDATTHLAEEIPDPQRNVPLAILLQVSIGFVTGLCYLIALMYSINDYDALFTSPYPIAEIYRQATGSAAGTIGLLSLIMVCIALTVVGLYITAGRTLWTLARDGAAPFPSILGLIHHRFHIPIWSTVITAVLVTVLGAIYVGNTTAFNNFVGSFILLSTSSFLACILPHLLTGRKNIKFGPFQMRGVVGFAVNGIACVYIIVWDIMYCFPAFLPTSAESMNYASVIWGGFTIMVGIWWFVRATRDYVGPPNLTI